LAQPTRTRLEQLVKDVAAMVRSDHPTADADEIERRVRERLAEMGRQNQHQSLNVAVDQKPVLSRLRMLSHGPGRLSLSQQWAA
jgi:hypothetical protein